MSNVENHYKSVRKPAAPSLRWGSKFRHDVLRFWQINSEYAISIPRRIGRIWMDCWEATVKLN